jgi:hypothetical protein
LDKLIGIFSHPVYEDDEQNILPIPDALELTWDDLANVPVVDPASVDDWNTYFELPTYGNPFTSVIISGNTVKLIGGSNIYLKELLFQFDSHIISVDDKSNCVTACDFCVFDGCSNLTTAKFPSMQSMCDGNFQNCFLLTDIDFSSLITSEISNFAQDESLINVDFPLLERLLDCSLQNCTGLINIKLPSCTTLGNTVGDDLVFNGIIGNVITLTVPAALMTCNGGAPDGDIQYLQVNNTVTIIQV